MVFSSDDIVIVAILDVDDVELVLDAVVVVIVLLVVFSLGC